MSTFVDSPLKIELIGTGEQVGTWGTTTNTNLKALQEAITGSVDVDFSSGDVTLTLSDSNSPQPARNLRLVCTNASGAQNLIFGSGAQIDKLYLIQNDSGYAITVKNTTGTGVTVANGKSEFVFNDGTNVVKAGAQNVSLTTDVTGTLPIANGGTNGTATPTDGGVAYGNGTAYAFSTAGTSGYALISQGTGSAPTWQQVTDSNTASTIVARDADGDFSAGTITATLDGSSSSCTGNAATATKLETARTIGGVSFDGTANINLPGVNTTGTQNTSGTAAGLSATLGVDKGGTGQTSYTNGQLLIGNTTSLGLTKATLTGTANRLTVTNGAGSITLNVDATNANTASKVVARDAAGDFSAGIITASLNGTANAAGKLSTASGSAPSYSARAWVNFDGTTAGVNPASMSIRGSGNVSSVTRTATGKFRINFTTAMPSDDYAIVGTHGNSTNAGGLSAISTSSSYAEIETRFGNALDNPAYVSVVVFN